MRKLLLLVGICLALESSGQNLYFPESGFKDSISLNKSMPELARAVIAVYKEKNLKPDVSLSRCQILAGQYAEAGNTLDSLPEPGMQLLPRISDVYVEVNNFVYKSFAYAKLKPIEDQTSFDAAYRSTFIKMFDALPGGASLELSIHTRVDLKSIIDWFHELLNKQRGKDSVSFADAKTLCSTYNSYIVNSIVYFPLNAIVAEVENRKYDIRDSVLINTRDGATISATVFRKRGVVGKQPTIFVFNIYTSYDRDLAIEIALRGYVAVVANTRGKRLSPQEIEPFEHDANDTYDVIDWISRQPWSNGKVGMYGGSYLGFTQWAALKKVHPALKTVVPQVAVGSGIDFPMHNQVFMGYALRWLHYVSNNKGEDINDFYNDDHWDSVYMRWYKVGRSFRSLDTLEGRPNKMFQRWLSHPSYDAYWQKITPYKTDFERINIPILTMTGYYDDDQLGALNYFRQHHLYNRHAIDYLVIGPYDHGGAQSVAAPVLDGYAIDPVANISLTELTFQWFDYILRDSAKPALLKDTINYEVMGANEWKHAPSLSKMANDTLDLYLSNEQDGKSYVLKNALPVTPGSIGQTIDLKDRSDTNSTYSPNMIRSSVDVPNGMTFISQPFADPFEINGAFGGNLNVSINKKDLDIFIKWYELMPDGKYFPLSYFGCLLRASYAKDRSRRQLLTPGKIESIPLNGTIFTSRKISAGSRLAIVIKVYKSKGEQVNYGTGKDVSDETIADGKIPLEVRWYNSSVIKIPVYK